VVELEKSGLLMNIAAKLFMSIRLAASAVGMDTSFRAILIAIKKIEFIDLA